MGKVFAASDPLRTLVGTCNAADRTVRALAEDGAGRMIGLILAALSASGHVAAEEPANQSCASFYFLYFPASRATITAGETGWEGHLSDYDPSTALSGSFRLCPVEGRVNVSTVAGNVTVTVPSGMEEAHILIESQDLPATRILIEAPLLD